MASTRRKRRSAQPWQVDRLLCQLRNDKFPATIAIHRRGKVVARLIGEADYQEVTGLMAEHLKHLADEGEKDAIPLDEVRAWLEQRPAERPSPPGGR